MFVLQSKKKVFFPLLLAHIFRTRHLSDANKSDECSITLSLTLFAMFSSSFLCKFHENYLFTAYCLLSALDFIVTIQKIVNTCVQRRVRLGSVNMKLLNLFILLFSQFMVLCVFLERIQFSRLIFNTVLNAMLYRS